MTLVAILAIVTEAGDRVGVRGFLRSDLSQLSLLANLLLGSSLSVGHVPLLLLNLVVELLGLSLGLPFLDKTVTN